MVDAHVDSKTDPSPWHLSTNLKQTLQSEVNFWLAACTRTVVQDMWLSTEYSCSWWHCAIQWLVRWLDSKIQSPSNWMFLASCPAASFLLYQFCMSIAIPKVILCRYCLDWRSGCWTLQHGTISCKSDTIYCRASAPALTSRISNTAWANAFRNVMCTRQIAYIASPSWTWHGLDAIVSNSHSITITLAFVLLLPNTFSFLLFRSCYTLMCDIAKAHCAGYTT